MRKFGKTVKIGDFARLKERIKYFKFFKINDINENRTYIKLDNHEGSFQRSDVVLKRKKRISYDRK